MKAASPTQFQSALRSPDRSDNAARLRRGCSAVSIRAPVTRPERLALERTASLPSSSFNPRSGHPTGATQAFHLILLALIMFQSALRSPDRSDSFPDCSCSRLPRFQSALRSPDRSDSFLGGTAPDRCGFNPRSGHPTGATGRLPPWPPRRGCFNPRSGHPTGATDFGGAIFVGFVEFQSALRSPDRSDWGVGLFSAAVALFQSALRSPDRSDMLIF